MTHAPYPMHLPPLPSITNSQVIIQGDVSIDTSAAIAPGVILQADPDSRIIIAAGVCIGMGAILHAHKGTVEVDAGAILGAGVLVVGVSKIGANACIGAATTVWNSSVESWQVLPAGSIVGDTGRKADLEAPPPQQSAPVTNESEASKEGVAEPVNPPSEALPQVASEVKTGTEEPANELNGNAPQSDQPASTPTPEPAPKEAELPQKQPESNPAVGVTVYGQAHLNRLLTTLFPYKAANNPPKDEE